MGNPIHFASGPQTDAQALLQNAAQTLTPDAFESALSDESSALRRRLADLGYTDFVWEGSNHGGKDALESYSYTFYGDDDPVKATFLNRSESLAVLKEIDENFPRRAFRRNQASESDLVALEQKYLNDGPSYLGQKLLSAQIKALHNGTAKTDDTFAVIEAVPVLHVSLP